MPDVHYLENGQAVHLVVKFDGGCVVKEILEDGQTGEQFVGDRQKIVPRVFVEPPEAVYNGQMVQTQAAIESLEADRCALAKQLRDDEKEYSDRLKKLAVLNPTLLNIERIINDEFTHLVILSSYGGPPSILERAKAKERGGAGERDPGGWGDREFQLLTMSVKNYKLTWQASIKAYIRRDSYDTQECLPCLSEAEALATLQIELDRLIAEQKHGARRDFVKCADEYGLVLPPTYRKEVEDAERANAESAIKKAERALADAQAKLEELHAAS